MLTQLHEAFEQMVEAIIEDGGSLPIRMVAVAANDAMLYMRIDQTGLSRNLTEYGPGELALPINAMFVEHGGNAYKMTITQQGLRFHS
jgi:hypothetical protein